MLVHAANTSEHSKHTASASLHSCRMELIGTDSRAHILQVDNLQAYATITHVWPERFSTVAAGIANRQTTLTENIRPVTLAAREHPSALSQELRSSALNTTYYLFGKCTIIAVQKSHTVPRIQAK